MEYLCMTKAWDFVMNRQKRLNCNDGVAGNGIISFFPVMFSPGLPSSLCSGNAPAPGLSQGFHP
jgi:hypothetical protein